LKKNARYRGHIRSKVLAYNPKACQICGYDKVVEVVHIKPRHKGGRDVPDNVVLLCPNHHKEYDRGKMSKKELLKRIKRYIEGVKLKRTDVYFDERGKLIEILRCDDALFKEFGQIYVSTIAHNAIKAWHSHKQQTDNIFCVKGNIKLVLYDNRKYSRSKGVINELFLGESNPLLVQIPPGVWHGWKGISDENQESTVINISDIPYNYFQPDEFRLDPYNNEIPYDWRRKDG